MKRVWIVVAVIILISSTIVCADETSHRTTALKLLEVTNTREIVDQTLVSLNDMMEQQFDSMELPPEGREEAREFKKEMMAWMEEFLSWEQLSEMLIDIYVEIFTEDEISELIGFYESPLGQKLLAKTPELMRKSMQKTQEVLQAKMPQIQQRIENNIAKLETKYGTVE